MFLLPARIELEFSEMTMNVIECDGERKVKRSSVFFSNGGGGGGGLTVILFGRVRATDFGLAQHRLFWVLK